MTSILRAAAYLPHHRLRRESAAEVVGGRPGRGTRTVASYDEDTTTMGVAAARLALGTGADRPEVDALTFATPAPVYLDKTNATAIHAALRLDAEVIATDAGGAARSTAGALFAAARGTGSTLVVTADLRTGRPKGPEELASGDGAAALLLGHGPGVAEVVAIASRTAEFLDRWRVPGAATSQVWEERFGETVYVPLARETYDAALTSAELTHADVDHLIVTGLHGRAVKRAARDLAGGRDDVLVDDLTDAIGNLGAAHGPVLLTHVLETAAEGAVIAWVSLADGCDVLVLRATPATASARASRTVAEQLGDGDDRLPYATFLAWRGYLDLEPPRRPGPARVSAPAAHRNAAWKFGFVGSRDRTSGALHLPPDRVSFDGGAVDDMDPAPMADVLATVTTFTVDHVAYSPSPPTVFAVLDFDGGGRLACALTDVAADEVAIGDRVEMTFRRIDEADGIVNYFYKARPVAAAAASTEA